jgi:hypothetical protein
MSAPEPETAAPTVQSASQDGPTFDGSARTLSRLSLLTTLGVLITRLLQPDRGIQFKTHLYLSLGFLTQVALVVVLSIIALTLHLRGKLRCAHPTGILSALAVAGLPAQLYAIVTINVDGSSVP